ncbi:hypothetical protein CJ010_22955 [Azoarcus sp. DD4]|nr:hypothetical protein CJ010_22955 [Azoarcus sp. DD4]
MPDSIYAASAGGRPESGKRAVRTGMKEVIGNFRILAKVGEGGMGNVFRGRDLMLERDVAIKSLRPELACYGEVVERFRTEAIALARLQHHNIANVFSFFAEDGQYYMVMEFVDGEPLNRLARRRGALPWREAVGLVVQALQGLEHAHHAGVVHRDIKPSNMIVTADGTLKLMDFGIARILEKVGLTRTGCVVGTLLYVSPEQARGGDVDARSDLYSVAVVLYELLTGRVPFDSGSEFELMRAHIELPPPPPSGLVAGLPPALEAVILRALAKSPADRYQGAEAFRAELEQLLATADSGDGARTVLIDLPTLPSAPAARRTATHGAAGTAVAAPAARSRVPLILAVAVLVLGAAAYGGWRWLSSQTTELALPAVTVPPAPAEPVTTAAPAAAEVPVSVQPEAAAPVQPPAAPAPVEAAPAPPVAAAVAPAAVPETKAPARAEAPRPPRVERTAQAAPPVTAPAARSAPPQRDGRCARLVQQLSLGERLAEADMAYLRVNCGN